MNWLDITLAVLAIVGLVKGWMDGFVRQIVTFIAFAAAIYLCSEVAGFLRGYVVQKEWFPEQSVTAGSYAVAFLLIAGLVLLAGRVIHKMISVTPLGFLNRLAGSAFGLLITVLLLSLMLNVLEGVDSQSALVSQETKVESRFYFRVREFAPAIYPVELFIWRK
ncbi:MAG: CvpA family protein [Tannerella sp.]|jgi:membrane protein required for colicin V production|nr:CvpA family protein [Tannerella sp.]